IDFFEHKHFIEGTKKGRGILFHRIRERAVDVKNDQAHGVSQTYFHNFCVKPSFSSSWKKRASISCSGFRLATRGSVSTIRSMTVFSDSGDGRGTRGMVRTMAI